LRNPSRDDSPHAKDNKGAQGAATAAHNRTAPTLVSEVSNLLTLYLRADILGAGCRPLPYSYNPMPDSSEIRLRADTHVHFHPCFEEGPFLDAAAESLLQDLAPTSVITAALCLTESHGDNWFATLARLGDGDAIQGTEWRKLDTEERNSVIVEDRRGRKLAIIAGRQIVCRERLEVLALGHLEVPDDGQPIRDVLRDVERAGAVPVLPWGFGKWTGDRKQVVQQLLDEPPCEFVLGDNGGRLRMLAEPELFAVARKKGFCILPGTDPFPFHWDGRRVGSYGMEWRGGLEPGAPFRSLKSLIAEQGRAGERFGRLESLPAFIRNQVAIQLRRAPSKLSR
jgi:hypothetical protein